MDTRQLAAFCAVVERRSFSQAADRLGVTQPAVSLQVRALEKRLGTQLLDRSGRRVEPTEAGWRLYRGAQRMLALEDQLVAEVAASGEGALAGDLVLGASTGPAAVVVPVVLGEFQRQNPDVRVFLTVSDTHSVVERVAARELELGIVGAARRHRGVRFEPFFSDEVILVCPPGHRFADRAVTLAELREEPLILMQEGAGVRQIVEDALRRQGIRLRDLDVRLELGLQESVRRAVEAGYGVTFISRTAVESDLAGRPPRRGPGRGARGDARDLARVRDRTSADEGGRRVRRVRSGAPRVVIVRWGIDELPALLDELGIERALLVTSARFGELDLPVAARFTGVRRHAPVDVVVAATAAAEGADGLVGVGGGSAIDAAKAVSASTGLRLVAVPTTYAGSEWTPYFGMRDEARRAKTGGSGAVTVAVVYEPTLTLELPRDGVRRHRHERARALRGGALRRVRARTQSSAPQLIATSLPQVAERGDDLDERTRLLEGAMHAGMALAERGLFLAHALAQALGGRFGVVPRRDERPLPRTGAALQRAGRAGCDREPRACARRRRCAATGRGARAARRLRAPA